MELTAISLQTVEPNQNVLFNETAIAGSCSIVHREGSGLVILRGLTRQARARFRVSFGANVAIPEGTEDVIPLSLSIKLNGEPVSSAEMISTPAAVGDFNNVYSSIFIEVPCNCCTQVSVGNSGDSNVEVQNANLIIERVA